MHRVRIGAWLLLAILTGCDEDARPSEASLVSQHRAAIESVVQKLRGLDVETIGTEALRAHTGAVVPTCDFARASGGTLAVHEDVLANPGEYRRDDFGIGNNDDLWRAYGAVQHGQFMNTRGPHRALRNESPAPPDDADLRTLRESLERIAAIDNVLIIRVTETERPSLTGEDEFTPGVVRLEVRGYSIAENRYLGGFPVVARSSATSYRGNAENLDQRLTIDLQTNSRIAMQQGCLEWGGRAVSDQ